VLTFRLILGKKIKLMMRFICTHKVCNPIITCAFYIFWRYLGFDSGPTPWDTLTAIFCECFVKIGSHILFAWTAFKLQSWSLAPEFRIPGVYHWCSAFYILYFILHKFSFTKHVPIWNNSCMWYYVKLRGCLILFVIWNILDLQWGWTLECEADFLFLFFIGGTGVWI
jgi:hypothetical protein